MSALDGIRVLELARVPPAEMPGMMLGDLGADVLKIETPSHGPLTDAQRRQAAFSPLNRNKRSIAIDLKTARGQELLARLAVAADVIVEGFRPGVMTRLGGDYETIRRINPRIVYCSLSAFGQTGPYRELPGHDLTILALAGILGLIGEVDRAPQIPLNLVADYAGASLHGVFGIMVALFSRERTGAGQFVDISYLDTSIALLNATPSMRRFWSDGIGPRRGTGFLSGRHPYYSVYDTLDRKYLAVACLEPKFWDAFCKAIGRPEFARFAAREDDAVDEVSVEASAVREEIQQILRTKTRDEWSTLLNRAGACVGRVLDPDEAADDPQVRARGLVVRPSHPSYGRVPQIGPPVKLSAAVATVRGAAPSPGQHTDDVLREIGIPPEEIARLRADGVVA